MTGIDGPPYLPGVLEQSHDRAERLAELDGELERVREFVQQGMRAGRISAESGQALIDTAEKQHAEAVARLGIEG